MKKILFLTLIVLATAGAAIAQGTFELDRIILKTKKVIEAKVIEVGTEEIKYKFSADPGAAIFSVKRVDVYKIEFADGHVEKFVEDLENIESYADQKQMAIKMEFLSPLYGYCAFSFEKLIKPGMSWEATLGIIGAGKDLEDRNPFGFHVKGGVRFLKTPDFKTGNIRYWHVLKGIYVKPELTFGAYRSTANYYSYDPITGATTTNKADQSTVYGALNLLLGKQHVFANIFLIDYYAGLGYGFSNTKTESAPQQNFYNESINDPRHYGMMVGNGVPISFTAGLKLGVLIK